MTPEQLRQNAAAMLAFADGKPVQYRNTRGVWMDTSNIEYIDRNQYRPKPQPVTRPWSKPEDVPGPVCWIRDPKDKHWGEHLVAVIREGEFSTVWGSTAFCTFENKEYSTDRKTWHPCVVTE